MKEVDLYAAVKMQEEEKPEALSPKEYAGFFSEKTWKKAETIVSTVLPDRLYRVGRWLVGRWRDGDAILVLGRDGKPQAKSCSCSTEGEECRHSAALALLWSTHQELFSERRIGAKRKFFSWSLPAMPLQDEEEIALTKEQLIEALADAVNSYFLLQDIKDTAKELGVGLGSGRKAELSKRLARHLLDLPTLQRSVENLPQETKVALAAVYFFPDLSKEVRKVFYESFGFDAPWEDAIQQAKHGIWQSYLRARLGPEDVMPVSDLHLIPVSTVAEVPGGSTVSRTPWDFLSDAYRLISLLDDGRFSVENFAAPARISSEHVKGNLFTWHPEWSVLPLDAGLIPIYFHVMRFGDKNPGAVDKRFEGVGAVLGNLLETLVTCGLSIVSDGRISILKENLQEFVKWERSNQVLVLERDFMSLAGRHAVHQVLRNRNYRLAGFYRLSPHYYFAREGMIASQGLLSFEMLILLRLLPRRKWIPWVELVKVTKAWADMSVAKSSLYGFFTDPWDDWENFFLDWLQEFLRLMAYAGALDLVERDGKIAFIRVTYLSEAFSVVKGAVGAETANVSPVAEITAKAAGPQRVFLYIPLDASPRLYSLLEKWKAQPELDHGRMQFRLDLQSLWKLFKKGESADSLLAQWRKVVGSPMPSLAERWLRAAYENYGVVRLYPGVTVVQFRDESVRRHMEAALPALRKQNAVELNSTALVLTSSEAQELRKDLEKSGYVPREVELSEKGKEA